MSCAEILARCGMSADDVRNAVQKNMKPVVGRSLSIADLNEIKYAGVETQAERYDKTHTGVYSEIQCGTDNGGCTTRRGTYRRIKTGDGRCSDAFDLRRREALDAIIGRNERGQFKKFGE